MQQHQPANKALGNSGSVAGGTIAIGIQGYKLGFGFVCTSDQGETIAKGRCSGRGALSPVREFVQALRLDPRDNLALLPIDDLVRRLIRPESEYSEPVQLHGVPEVVRRNQSVGFSDIGRSWMDMLRFSPR